MRLSLARLLPSFFVISLAVMLGRRLVSFCGRFMMLSGFGVRFLGHAP